MKVLLLLQAPWQKRWWWREAEKVEKKHASTHTRNWKCDWKLGCERVLFAPFGQDQIATWLLKSNLMPAGCNIQVWSNSTLQLSSIGHVHMDKLERISVPYYTRQAIHTNYLDKLYAQMWIRAVVPCQDHTAENHSRTNPTTTYLFSHVDRIIYDSCPKANLGSKFRILLCKRPGTWFDKGPDDSVPVRKHYIPSRKENISVDQHSSWRVCNACE